MRGGSLPSGRKYRGMGQFAGQAAINAWGRSMQSVSGGKVAMHKAAGHNGRCRG